MSRNIQIPNRANNAPRVAPKIGAPTVAPVAPPAPQDDDDFGLFDTPPGPEDESPFDPNVPTSGIPYDEAMKRGLKGSQAFGARVPPAVALADAEEEDDPDEDEDDDLFFGDTDSETEAQDDDEEDEGWGDDDDGDGDEDQGGDGVDGDEEVALPEEAHISPDQLNPELARAMWAEFDPRQMTVPELLTMLSAATVIIQDQDSKLDLIRGIVVGGGSLPKGGVQVTIAPPQPTEAKAPVVAPSAPAAPAEKSPMDDKCKNIGRRCWSMRRNHKDGTGPCFDPKCSCGGKCQSFVGKPLPGAVAKAPVATKAAPPVVAQKAAPAVAPRVAPKVQSPPMTNAGPEEQEFHETTIEYDNAEGGASGPVASSKSGGGNARVDAGPNTKRPPTAPASQGTARPTTPAANAGQGTGQEGKTEQLAVTPKVLRSMIDLKLGSGPETGEDRSTYWPFKSQKDISGIGGAESRRNTMNDRIEKFWDKAIRSKEDPNKVNPGLNLKSNSYRVILAARGLGQAIEDYATLNPRTPETEANADKAVAQALKAYLEAHKPLPDGEMDCDYKEYLGYCEAFQLPVGRPLSDLRRPVERVNGAT